MASFKYHNAPITSVEWSTFDSTTLATASCDNQVAVWDLAVERDPEEEAAAVAEATTALPPPELPPQLMFVHQVRRASWLNRVSLPIMRGRWHLFTATQQSGSLCRARRTSRSCIGMPKSQGCV